MKLRPLRISLRDPKATIFRWGAFARKLIGRIACRQLMRKRSWMKGFEAGNSLKLFSWPLRRYHFVYPIFFPLISHIVDKEGLSASSTQKDPPCMAIMGVRHIENKGVGYKQGYTTLEGLIFAPGSGSFIPFIDLRAHVFNDADYAANAGVGFRRRTSSHSSGIFGMNAYYDFRTGSDCRVGFDQVGVGMEWLSKALDLRLNGYVPINSLRACDRYFFGYEGGYYVAVKETGKAFIGANIEIGRILKSCREFTVYGAVGPYYYNGNIYGHAWGGKLRLNGKFKKYVSVEGSVSYDDFFGLRVQGELIVRFPFGGGSSRHRDRLYQPVERNEIIVLDERLLWEWNY